MKKNNLLLAASLGALALASCGKSGPKKTPGGIAFTIEKAGKGEKLKKGDTVLVHFASYLNDSLLMSSRQQQGSALPLVITESRDKYDLMDGFAMLTEGDSAVFVLPVDSMPQMPPMAKKGDVMKVAFVVESKYAAAKQNAQEEKEIAEYIQKNNLKTTKSPKGVHIAVTQEGTGAQAKAGDEVTVNYTGKLMDGTKFDSNVDSTIRPGMPLEPLKFNVGEGRVIPGWDDALAQLKKGSKATLVIPSSLAYGLQGSGPIIKPNSILVFDVELLDVKPGAPAEIPATPPPPAK
ncbi:MULTISPECIES: FKBP-type peptidyl-prolyl cis-trans isomerase [Chitinophaga]|nr:FKBP-type peptidyl-prolyl cis-trans isomerase [Chitinophaga chungangae]